MFTLAISGVNILGWKHLMALTPSTRYCPVRHSPSFGIPQLSPKWSHKSFWYETGNVLNKCWKETKAIVLMYFLPEVLFKKIKTALRIAFSWIVKKKKKRTPHCNFQACYRKQTCFFFFGLMVNCPRNFKKIKVDQAVLELLIQTFWLFWSIT